MARPDSVWFKRVALVSLRIDCRASVDAGTGQEVRVTDDGLCQRAGVREDVLG